MPSAPLGLHGQYLRQCMHCHISEGDGARLQACAACRVALYCTRECQKKNWSTHKPQCLLNQNGEKVGKMAEAAKLTVNGLPVKEVDHRFQKWQQVAQPILDYTLLHALDLHADQDRCFTHMLWVTVKENMSTSTPKATTASEIVKYFRFVDATIHRIVDLVPTLTSEGMRNAITSSVENSRGMRRRGENFGILIMIVFLESLNLQQLMTQTLDRFDPVLVSPNKEWKKQLRILINNGAVL